MKKKIKYLVILLLLNIIFIGTANAESYIVSYFDSNLGQNGFEMSNIQVMNNYKNVDLRFNSNNYFSTIYFNELYNGITIENNVNQFTFPFSITDLEHNSEKMTCNSTYQVQETYTLSYQTLYADGTTSQNDGVINENIAHPQFCTYFNVNEINDYSINIGYQLNDNSTYNCLVTETNKSNVAVCPIQSSKANGQYTIKQIFMVFTRNDPDNNTKVRVRISMNLVKQKDTQQSILDVINDLNSKINQSNNIQSQIQNNTNEIKNDIKSSNTKLDEIKNSDISNDNKEAPNTNEFNDYQDAENGLFDKMKQADTNNLDVAIDGNSANFIWDTITKFYNSNALLMNFLISILSIGIIKMALGR